MRGAHVRVISASSTPLPASARPEPGRDVNQTDDTQHGGECDDGGPRDAYGVQGQATISTASATTP